jgi:hypothetical protein
MTGRKPPLVTNSRPIDDEVRVGDRNFVRRGDLIKVRPSGKTQFSSGWKFLGWDAQSQVALVKDPRTGNIRNVTLDCIKRVAVTKNGERLN